MSRLVLGNRDAQHSTDNGESYTKLPKGKRATTVEIPDELNLADAFKAITDRGGIWATHASEGATPAWVASDDKPLATLVAAHFGGIEIRELEENS